MRIILTGLVAVIFLLLVANAANALDEARVRYILADSQLGDVIGYYRGHMDEPECREAVRKWEAGCRVANISEFRRVIVSGKGWQVVYKGTEKTVDAGDIKLTCDQNEKFDERRVRYIMADSQLGDVIGYYRDHLDEPECREAVRRWDADCRVVNIDRFQRVVVEGKGWQVVYRNTERTIDPTNIRLSCDKQPAYDEGRVRYILTDSQLSGLIGYYRQHLDEAECREACQRWDSGVRVRNIESFERVNLPGKGWIIVYKGTKRAIDGMDAELAKE